MADITLQNLKGSWSLDTSVGDNTDGILKLQGVGWLTRKGIGAATLTLHFTTKTETSEATNPPVAHLTMRQTLTGGIPGSTEERIMDWAERERSNHIYGDTVTRSKFIDGVKGDDGAVQPELTLESKPASDSAETEVKNFLRSGSPRAAEGDLKGLYIHDFGRNEKAGWTAEQVWSLEDINGTPHLIRRVAVAKGDEIELARLAYKFSGL